MRFRAASVGLGLLLMAVTSCSVVRQGTTQTTTLIRRLGGVGAQPPEPSAIEQLQQDNMRAADTYVAAVGEAADQFGQRVAVTEGRILVLKWKLEQASAAYRNATGDNPALGAVDMVVMATLSRMVVENDWVGGRFGAAAQPMLEVQRNLETMAWNWIGKMLSAAEQQELRRLIQEWWDQNPDLRSVVVVQFHQFVGANGRNAAASASQPGSLLQLVGVNPLAGLDPAVQEVERTRLMAERGMYYLERMPTLVRWQTELLAYQLAEQPETKSVLADAARISKSTVSFANLADALPALADRERRAAIEQLLSGIASERSNILVSLDSQEQKLRTLLPEARQTLQAGGEMARAVEGAVQSLDAFVRYVSPPHTNSPPAADTNSVPFNVLDYGRSAAQIGAMARDINALLTGVNQSVPQLTKATEQSSAEVERLLQRGFRLGLILVAVLLFGSVVAALVYRALARRWFPDRSPRG